MGRAHFALLAFALVFLGVARAPAVHAINYAPGWNLVSGPEGSHLVGAVGNIYTLQPGDADYEVLPAENALSGGYGYWAYFPQGGALDATYGTESYQTVLVAGQWALLGNPSSKAGATVTGSFSALAYIPGGDYVSVSTIPVGTGAWVLGAGEISVSAPPGSTPPVPPLAVTAFVDPVKTTTSFAMPGELVLQIDVYRNGLPVPRATVSGSLTVTSGPLSIAFGPTILATPTQILRFPTAPIPLGSRILIHVDAKLDGAVTAVDLVYLVNK